MCHLRISSPSYSSSILSSLQKAHEKQLRKRKSVRNAQTPVESVERKKKIEQKMRNKAR